MTAATAPTPVRNLSPAHPMSRRVDTSNLSAEMARVLNMLERWWDEADEDEDPEGMWVPQGAFPFISQGTVNALWRRGFHIQRRKTYHGYQYRMPEPHPAGLTGLGWW